MFGGKEPAVVFGGLGEIFKAVIPVLILFEMVNWTDKQIAGIMFLVGVVITFLTTMFTRSQTVSVPTANRQIEVAVNSPIGTKTESVVQQVAKEG